MKKLIRGIAAFRFSFKNTIIETYCVKHCCQDMPKRAVHAEGGAVSINTKVKSEDTAITDTRNHRQRDGQPVSRDQTISLEHGQGKY